MVDVLRLKKMMEEERLDALVVQGARNCAYIRGHVDQETWLADANDLALPIAVVSFPDKSFGIGCRIEGIDSECYDCDQILDARLTMLAVQLKSRGLHLGRLGMDMYYTPANSLARLKDLLPDAEFVSADEMLLRMRASKTPREVEYIRKALFASENAFKEVTGVMREGVSYREVAQEWARAVIANGALPAICIPYDLVAWLDCGQRRPGMKIDRWPSHAERGTMTRLDLVAVYRGYFCDQKMTICIGEPSKEAVGIFNEHVDRLNFMQEIIRPGITKQEVYAACAKEFKHVDEYCWWIHGVGLDVHEEPRVGSLLPHSVNVNTSVTFEEGAVLALEPSWIVEDTFIVKKGGVERLGTLPLKIWIF